MSDKREANTGEKRIKRCETVRMWMIVLAAILLLGGYVTSLLPRMYACVLPLLIAGALTYAIKYLERKQDETETDEEA